MFNQFNNTVDNPAVVQEVNDTEFHGFQYFKTNYSNLTNNNINEVRSQNIESIVSKSYSLSVYFSYFQNICNSLLDFHSLLNLKNTFFNAMLFDLGSFAIVREKETDGERYAVRKFFISDFNEEGEPSKITASQYVPMGWEAKTVEKTYDYNDFVIFKLNPTMTPLRHYVYYFVSKIVDVQKGIDNNVWQQQQPVIIEAGEEQKTAMTNFFDKLKQRVPAIFVKKNAHIEENLSTINIGGEWTADKGIEVKEDLKHEFFTFLGIDHIPFEKKERLITAEASANDMLLDISRNAMLLSLNEGLEEAKKKGFDLAISSIDFTFDTEPEEKESFNIVEEPTDGEPEGGKE